MQQFITTQFPAVTAFLYWNWGIQKGKKILRMSCFFTIISLKGYFKDSTFGQLNHNLSM